MSPEACNGKPNVRIRCRFVSDGSAGCDGAHVDNVRIQGSFCRNSGRGEREERTPASNATIATCEPSALYMTCSTSVSSRSERGSWWATLDSNR